MEGQTERSLYWFPLSLANTFAMSSLLMFEFVSTVRLVPLYTTGVFPRGELSLSIDSVFVFFWFDGINNPVA